LPRQVFVKSPAEQKPFYVDFDSPVLVSLLSKAVRQGERKGAGDGGGGMITMTEMLPGPEQAWLPDAEGNLYTSELRIVAIDSPA
ncbi:MAG TPA: lantibiotic dehydratase, partial [Blastocatellia bacterium]|nr:lantibiotic dehydratase [Blastocatellia bacterium]